MTENVELVPLTSSLSCYAPNPKEAQFIYKEIFEDHCYDIPSVLPLNSPTESSGPFIIDAGANIGLFTLYMKQKYPASKILAFEPAPQLVELLCRNLALNNIAYSHGDSPHHDDDDDDDDDNNTVEVFPIGLSTRESEEKLTYYPTLPSNSTLKPEEKVLLHREAVKRSGQEMADHWFGGSYEVDVKLQRLSHILSKKEKRVIDLLKIDVEGAELDVLRGIDDEQWGLIRNIVLETMEKSGIRTEIEELLKQKEFEFTTEGAPWAPQEFYTIRAHREMSSI